MTALLSRKKEILRTMILRINRDTYNNKTASVV
jgi:hypothetical protein